MADPYLVDLQPGDTPETRDIVIQRWLSNIATLVVADGLPSQTGKNGQFLTTDGTTASWSAALVLSIAGTAGNVAASASTGAVTLSLPTAVYSITSLGVNTGANAATTELEVVSTSTASPRGIQTRQFTTDTLGARLGFQKARGTRAAPTTIVSGDNVGRLNAWPYDGTNFLEMASIIFGTEGTIAATRTPTNIQFWTGTNAAPSVLTQAANFDSSQVFNLLSGSMTVGTTTPGSITGSAGALTFTAAGTNQNITLTPSGTGGVVTGSGSNYSSQVTNGLFVVAGGVAKASANTGNQGTFLIGSNDAANQFQGQLILQTSATAGLRRLAIQSVEQGVGFRNVTINENGGNLIIGSPSLDGGQKFQVYGTALLSGTNTLKFGATAAATIGVSSDTTAGNLNLTAPSTGALQSLSTYTAAYNGSNPSGSTLTNAYILEVQGANSTGHIRLWDTNGFSSNNGPRMDFAIKDGRVLTSIKAANPGPGGDVGHLLFYTRTSDTVSETMRLTGAGNLLIGVTTDSGNRLQLASTGKIQFGATAVATIGVSADTTAGNLVHTAPTGGLNSLVGGTTNTMSFTTQNTVAQSYSGIGILNHTGTEKMTLGFGNSSASVFTGKAFINTDAVTLVFGNNGAEHTQVDTSGNFFLNGSLTILQATGIPAGGTAGAGYRLSSTTNFGIFFGSGAPTLSAAKGSLYLRSDGSGTTDRMYVNTNGSTTWTNVVTSL